MTLNLGFFNSYIQMIFFVELIPICDFLVAAKKLQNNLRITFSFKV